MATWQMHQPRAHPTVAQEAADGFLPPWFVPRPTYLGRALYLHYRVAWPSLCVLEALRETFTGATMSTPGGAGTLPSEARIYLPVCSAHRPQRVGASPQSPISSGPCGFLCTYLAGVGSGVHKIAQPVSFMAGIIRLSVYLIYPAPLGFVVGPAVWSHLEGHVAAVELRSMQDPANELRRIPLLKLFGK